VYVYLAASFHVIDFRVTVTISSRPKYTTVPLISLSLHQSEYPISRLLPFTYIPSYKTQRGEPRALGCWVYGRKRGTPEVATRTLQTTYMSQSDPGFLLTAWWESCVWSLDVTLLSRRLWSLAMATLPSPKLLEPVHTMHSPQLKR